MNHKWKNSKVLTSTSSIKDDGEVVELVAPMTFVGKPGRKIAHIIETVVFQNIFATDETDIEKLELMFVETPALEGN